MDAMPATLQRRLEPAAWALAAGALFWSFGFTRLAGSDLYWHLANGRWMLAHRSLPRADPFSFTREGGPWLQHEWLSGLTLALWERSFGLETLVYWKWLVIVAAFLLLFGASWRGSGPLAAILATAMAAATAAPFLDVRPNLYALLGLALVIYGAWERRPAAWMPLVFLAWVNLHGSFAYGLLALAILLAPAFLSSDTAARRRALLVLAASCLATLVNPHGPHIFLWPLAYVVDWGSVWRRTAEWRSPLVPGPLVSPLFPWSIAVLFAATLFLALRRGRPRSDALPWSALALSLVTLAMALASRRIILLFAACAAPVVARALARVPLPTGSREFGEARGVGVAFGAPLLVLAIATARLAAHPLDAGRAFPLLTGASVFPAAAVTALEGRAARGRVFNLYNWGGYLHWRTGGRFQVFVDGRADAVYDQDTLHRYLAVVARAPGWEAIVEDEAARFFLWPAVQPHGDALLASGRWRPVHRDGLAVVLERGAATLAADSRAAVAAERRALP